MPGPWTYAILGVALTQTARRLTTTSPSSPHSTRQNASHIHRRLKRVQSLVGNFDPSRPSTWAPLIDRVISQSLDSRRGFENSEQARDMEGFTLKLVIPEFVLHRIISQQESSSHTRTLYEDGTTVVYLLELSNTHACALELCRSSTRRDGTLSISCYLHIDDQPHQEQLITCLMDLFWSSAHALRLENSEGRITISTHPLDDYHYLGDRLELVTQWRQFMDCGIRRNVLLQGPPGHGKTTLCYHAARELSTRTMIIEPSSMGTFSHREWFDMLNILKPQVLILEDIEREAGVAIKYRGIGVSDGLEQRLRFLEEGYCHVPLVLISSNEYTRIPVALRRPGRIDQIIQFDSPSPDMQAQLLERMAREEDVTLPKIHLPWLRQLMDDYSVAHAREALRRAKVMGWTKVREDDVSFLLQRDFDSEDEWRHVHGFAPSTLSIEPLILALMSRLPLSVVYEDEHDILYGATLEQGEELAFRLQDRNRYERKPILYERQTTHEQEDIKQAIAQVLWQGRTLISIDAVGRDELIIHTMETQQQLDYYGPLLDEVDRWRQFQQHNLRRSVLLQGQPGTGKSTFCLHAARLLSRRTILLTPAGYEALSCNQWRTLVDYMRPTMIIVDDVDRVSQGILTSRLKLLEEGYASAPFMFFTSNDHLALPGAMRRPGRIDEVIELNGQHMTRGHEDLLELLAGREQVSIPPSRKTQLLELLRSHSPAHVVERLRRARISGWDAPDIPGDITFSMTQEDSATPQYEWITEDVPF